MNDRNLVSGKWWLVILIALAVLLSAGTGLRSWLHNKASLATLAHLTRSSNCTVGGHTMEWVNGPSFANLPSYMSAVAGAAGAPGVSLLTDTEWNRDPRLLYWSQAQTLIKQGKLSASLPYLRQAHVENSLRTTANVLYSQGEDACALLNWLLATEISGDNLPDDGATFALELLGKQKAQPVIQSYSEALAYQPDQMRWHIMLAKGLLSLDQLSTAKSQLETSVLQRGTPVERAEAYTMLGAYYLDKKEVVAGRTSYEQAYQASGTPHNALQLVAVLLSLNEAEIALDYLPRAVQAEDALDRAVALQRWGQALQQLGRIAEAEKRFREGISVDPTYPGSAIDLAPLLTKLGKRDEAETLLRSAISNTKRDDFKAAVESALATHLAATGRIDEAIPHYQAAVELQPQTVGYTLNYARMLNQQGRRSEAAAVLTKYLQSHPDNKEARALQKSLEP